MTTSQCSLIVKAALSGEAELVALNVMNVYEKEMEMYEIILPQLTVLLHRIDENRQMFADTIFVYKCQKAILLEDLSVKGFRVNADKNGFDVTHTKAILSRLAKFHGAAAVLQEQQPDIYRNFKHGEH